MAWHASKGSGVQIPRRRRSWDARAMLLDLTPDGLLATTRSVRKRLDLTRPVEREVLEECLRLAQQAPTRGAVLPPRACVRLRYSSGSDSSVLVIAVSRAGW